MPLSQGGGGGVMYVTGMNVIQTLFCKKHIGL